MDAKTICPLPREHEDFIAALRTRGSLLPDSGGTGWVPMDLYSLSMRISEMETLGVIKPGMKVLDLGAGCATSTLIFAFRGYKAVGIEMNEPLAEVGAKAISEAVDKGLVKKELAPDLFVGSYYPRDYVLKRSSGETLALSCEHVTRSSHYHPIAEFDAYERFGIDIKSFDFFYIWAW